MNMDLDDAERTIKRIRSGSRVAGLPSNLSVVGIIPVHVAGLMLNVDDVAEFAVRHGLWVVEDAAHAFPAAWRRGRRSVATTAEKIPARFPASRSTPTRQSRPAREAWP